jgi:glutamate/tyrosine decarboxylase-like PLP-dependent enzyme
LSSLHAWTAETDALGRSLLAFARERLTRRTARVTPPASPSDLARVVPATITSEGIGSEEALRVFRDLLVPASSAIDHPSFLAFIPSAPTPTAMLADLAVGASSIYAGTWLEGAGAIYAENQTLRWLADLAGLPADAGGCFVSGGTIGNLSALVAARDAWRRRRDASRRTLRFAASADAHSSVRAVASVMDVEIMAVPPDEQGRMTAAALTAAIAREGSSDLFAVVATAGTTNLGAIDELDAIAVACREHDLWLHVDGAYGAAALAAESARPMFIGIEQADSLIVDPHKWLFSPFDCCALLYRNPELARRAHAQHASYLDPITVRGEWNASDYAIHLTRRARGLPLWFSLASHGTRSYGDAIETTLRVARGAAREIDQRDYLHRVHDPQLSILVFSRQGWSSEDYADWSSKLLADGTAFVMPTTYGGETAARIAIVNPKTTLSDIRFVLDTMA